MDEDYSAGREINEPVCERSNRHGSESSTLEIDVYVWCYALIVVHGGNERTCIEDAGELFAAEVSAYAGFADSVVAEVAADEVATLTTPATLLITAVHILLNACIVVQRVAFLHRQTSTSTSRQLDALLTIMIILMELSGFPLFY